MWAMMLLHLVKHTAHPGPAPVLYLASSDRPTGHAARELPNAAATHSDGLIGIGRGLATPLLPHHRTYGSRIRRFGRLSQRQGRWYNLGTPSLSKYPPGSA